MSWEVEELRYGFGDAAFCDADVDRVLRTARWAWERWHAGDRVLIRCQAGLNRSGLVTALVLMLDGHNPAAAIRLLRERRSPWALCNNHFVDWLVDEADSLLSAYGSAQAQVRRLGHPTVQRNHRAQASRPALLAPSARAMDLRNGTTDEDRTPP